MVLEQLLLWKHDLLCSSCFITTFHMLPRTQLFCEFCRSLCVFYPMIQILWDCFHSAFKLRDSTVVMRAWFIKVIHKYSDWCTRRSKNEFVPQTSRQRALKACKKLWILNRGAIELRIPLVLVSAHQCDIVISSYEYESHRRLNPTSRSVRRSCVLRGYGLVEFVCYEALIA